MLWVGTFHIVFIASWFAGLFHLPRIFVNLAIETERAAITRLLIMARKLFHFATILAIIAIPLGLWLFLGYCIGLCPPNGWMRAKLALVFVTIRYHHGYGMLLRKSRAGANRRSHKFYRWFNELPVLLLLAITILVVVKPFWLFLIFRWQLLVSRRVPVD